MADQPGYPDTDDTRDDTAVGPERDSPPRVPRWVWVSAIIVGVLLVLVVVVMLVGGGQHGPARHTSSGGTSVSGSLSGTGEAGGVGGLAWRAGAAR